MSEGSKVAVPPTFMPQGSCPACGSILADPPKEAPKTLADLAELASNAIAFGATFLELNRACGVPSGAFFGSMCAAHKRVVDLSLQDWARRHRPSSDEIRRVIREHFGAEPNIREASDVH